MSLNPALVSAYRFHRAYGRTCRKSQPHFSAADALRFAREDVAAGKARYPHDGKPVPAVSWARGDEPLRGYVQSIEGAGLRHVGDVVGDCGGRNGLWNNRSDRGGWYTDPHGDVFKDGTGLCWGVVYQLPARDGKARFVPGYIFGGCSDDLPTIDFATVYEEDARGGYNDNPQDYEAAKRAASDADAMASQAAEAERDYQSAYGAGSRYADLGAQIAEWRKGILALGKDRRAAKGSGSFPAICEAVRKAMSGLADDIAEARKERAALASGEGYGRESWCSFWTGENRLREAFNEGAGTSVL